MRESGTYELVVDEGDGEELVEAGTRAKLEAELEYLLSDYEPGASREGEPRPPFRIQPAA